MVQGILIPKLLAGEAFSKAIAFVFVEMGSRLGILRSLKEPTVLPLL